jgi:hypothetical protein
MLFTIALVGLTTRTGEYSFNRSEKHLEITVDFPVPGSPVIGIVSSPYILFLAEYCSSNRQIKLPSVSALAFQSG